MKSKSFSDDLAKRLMEHEVQQDILRVLTSDKVTRFAPNDLINLPEPLPENLSKSKALLDVRIVLAIMLTFNIENCVEAALQQLTDHDQVKTDEVLKRHQ